MVKLADQEACLVTIAPIEGDADGEDEGDGDEDGKSKGGLWAKPPLSISQPPLAYALRRWRSSWLA